MQTNTQKIINAEYLQWRKHIPKLYNLLIHHVTDTPVMSVQWLNQSKHLLLAVHSATHHLSILELNVPQVLEDETPVKNTLSQAKKVFMQDEVNRAKCNPTNNNLVATRSDEKTVKIYDLEMKTKDLEMKTKDLIDKQPVCLHGHTKGGYGVDWNYFTTNLLVTCGEDNQVCLFDATREGSATQVYGYHTAVVNDVCFSRMDGNVFVSVGDDNKIAIQDIRATKAEVWDAHDSDILSAEWSYFDENRLCTGSADATVKIWDRRKMNEWLHSCNYHTGSINQVRWSPHFENVLASCSNDRLVCIWDLGKVGDPCEEGPSELEFVHGGHKANVSDIAWNPVVKDEVASVSYDNVVQIWSRATNE